MATGGCVLALRITSLAVLPAACALFATESAHAQSAADLARLSLVDLTDIQVTSVSKRAEPLSAAASAVFVITHDDIARAGASSVPDMLRLAPNLQVSQTSAGKYVVTARGFGGQPQAQSFSNKLLVLIDGRSVYTPLYSGVYWDMQDVLPQDVDRIEVISGPGATLWGANAVNGVVNIITRSSAQTQGGLAAVAGGARERRLDLRYGGALSDELTYRAYARLRADGDTETAAGARADDDFHRLQGGFRVDFIPSAADAFTVQGDAYEGALSQGAQGDENIAGRTLLARWRHTARGGSQLQLQGYYDRTARATEGGGGKFALETFDVDVQHSLALAANDVVWGGGVRRSRYRIDGTPTFFFAPPSRTLNLVNLFAQDTVALGPDTRITFGLKYEDDPYVDPAALPSARLSWSASEGVSLWAAVSKAVRSPTPFDRDVVEKLAPDAPPQLIGDPQFRHEKLTAYEAGGRFRPLVGGSFSISAFYNDYDSLRTIELSPGAQLPLRWGNLLEGHSYGVDAWGEYDVRPWWRLSAGVSTLRKKLAFKAGATGILGVGQAGDDPKYRGLIRSSMDLPHALTLDAALRYQSALPSPRVPAYVELDARLAWDISARVQLALSGRNPLHDRHQEYPLSNAVPRAVLVDLTWKF